MERLQGWTDWYEFARSAFEYEHGEAEVYARKRYLEELNREKLATGESPAASEAERRWGKQTPS